MENNERKNNSLTELMEASMSKIRDMVDSNTIIGEPIQTPDGVTLIPVSRLSFGFGCGGGDYGKQAPKFGGASTAGVKVEYSRQLKGNFYWGVDFSARWHLGSLMSYDWSGHGSDPYRNTVAQDIYKLDAMAYYRLPVVKSRLFLRFGAGVGAGYHRILKHVDNDLDKDRVLPFFNVECAWILRVTKGFELKFSPTILFVPSEFSVSPVELGAPTDVTPWLTDAGFSLTCGWRF